MKKIDKLFLIFSLFLLSANTANAYLDAGTGSYVLQLVLGGILGGLFILKSYFRKIIFLFRKIITKKEKKSNE